MRIAIIGVGLIGGSVGLALKKRKRGDVRIIGAGRSRARLALARRLGAIDEYSTDITAAVGGADAVFICLPVGMIAPTLAKILPYLKNSAVVTDAGSVKKIVCDETDKIMAAWRKKKYGQGKIRPAARTNGPFFVGAHPIAGAEKTSVRNARADMFVESTTVITPTKNTARNALETAKKLWRATGSKTIIMPPAKHDAALARTSHMPHAVAYALVNAAGDLQCAGGGFLDTTRIASSDPAMWADILMSNKKETLRALASFKKEISSIEKARRTADLVKIFTRAKNKRDALKKRDAS